MDRKRNTDVPDDERTEELRGTSADHGENKQQEQTPVPEPRSAAWRDLHEFNF